MNIQLQFSNTKLSKSSPPCLSLCDNKVETDSRVGEMKTAKKRIKNCIKCGWEEQMLLNEMKFNQRKLGLAFY